MAILSDCTSCKVVDQVGTISHTPPAGWETGAALRLDFKLFKATYEVHRLGKLWPAKSHLGPQRALDLWRLWWINLRASGVAFVKQRGEGGQRFKYVWPFFPPRPLILFSARCSGSLAFPNVQMFICHHGDRRLADINATSSWVADSFSQTRPAKYWAFPSATEKTQYLIWTKVTDEENTSTLSWPFKPRLL